MGHRHERKREDIRKDLEGSHVVNVVQVLRGRNLVTEMRILLLTLIFFRKKSMLDIYVGSSSKYSILTKSFAVFSICFKSHEWKFPVKNKNPSPFFTIHTSISGPSPKHMHIFSGLRSRNEIFNS